LQAGKLFYQCLTIAALLLLSLLEKTTAGNSDGRTSAVFTRFSHTFYQLAENKAPDWYSTGFAFSKANNYAILRKIE